VGALILTIPRVVTVGWVIRIALEAVLEGELRVRAGSLVGYGADVVDGCLTEPASLVLGQDFGTLGRLQAIVSS